MNDWDHPAEAVRCRGWDRAYPVGTRVVVHRPGPLGPWCGVTTTWASCVFADEWGGAYVYVRPDGVRGCVPVPLDRIEAQPSQSAIAP